MLFERIFLLMLGVIGTRITRITQIFTDFTPLCFLINFCQSKITRVQFLFKQKALTKIVEHLVQKIRENPRYPHHPRSHHARHELFSHSSNYIFTIRLINCCVSFEKRKK